ncbi:hypothetical protein [Stenotrophomonas rhizophila]|uniref:hypothetical protein n=1 Tax=Stenotrophomonas rhizophila TaxID=216778 RepID=UPI001E4DCD5F|nr:hypothetical protein [Stenotrophomonas rhizophila]MCC7633279.1 hypothetical protein [Stenotrophomonas rhizophila]MCC7662171.1 hypothetical protein [Stenotrophomonas rhizophila]
MGTLRNRNGAEKSAPFSVRTFIVVPTADRRPPTANRYRHIGSAGRWPAPRGADQQDAEPASGRHYGDAGPRFASYCIPGTVLRSAYWRIKYRVRHSAPFPEAAGTMEPTQRKPSEHGWALVLWGRMDAAQILIYVASALRHDRTPYLHDIAGSIAVLDSHGWMALTFLAPSWVLQASLFASCALLLWRSRLGVYLAYVQIPLRLMLLMPSVPFALMLVRHLDIAPTTLLVLSGCLLLLVESLKLGMLRRACRPVPPASINAKRGSECGT